MQTPRSPFGIGLVTLMVLVGVGALVYMVRAPTQPLPEHATVPQKDLHARQIVLLLQYLKEGRV